MIILPLLIVVMYLNRELFNFIDIIAMVLNLALFYCIVGRNGTEIDFSTNYERVFVFHIQQVETNKETCDRLLYL